MYVSHKGKGKYLFIFFNYYLVYNLSLKPICLVLINFLCQYSICRPDHKFIFVLVFAHRDLCGYA